ncbi:MAG: hypothetical protein MZV70_31655 [Desulfobacterales bacterium]|nr:hypothetical protein [Desulfobacterales bacterium]
MAWLERNIHDETILPDEKAAFLNNSVEWLLNKGFTLDELIYDKYRLRTVLENKVANAKDRGYAPGVSNAFAETRRFHRQ